MDDNQEVEQPTPLPLAVDQDVVVEAEKKAVDLWTRRIRHAKRQRQDDFKRMREDIAFCAGRQYPGQKTMRSKQYQTNVTLKAVNLKVSSLYARNPVAEYQRRKRLDFELYNGHLESLLPIVQQAAAHPMGFLGLPYESKVMLADYMRGMETRERIDRAGTTLEIVYQWNFDEHEPSMLEQMKALVRRVVTCGVGYVRVGYQRVDEPQITSEGVGNDRIETLRRAKALLEKIEEGEVEKESPELATLIQLVHSLASEAVDPETQTRLKENLTFDFPSSTQVIVDLNCTCLTDFVGARWIAIEYVLPQDEVEAYFEVKLPMDKVRNVGSISDETDGNKRSPSDSTQEKPKVVVWELMNKQTQGRCFLCDGYERYLSPPEPMPVKVFGFWPIRALTFNDVEFATSPGCEPDEVTSIYPPSDVDLMWHAQKEWNRTRQDLKSHRKANIPMYITMKNYLSAEDRAKILHAVPNEVVELTASLPQGMKPDELVSPKQKVPIDPAVYDITPLQQDILFSIGAQEANLGPPNPQGTATGQTIAEQSRISGSNSNIDDLDNLLSWMARCGGDIILREFSRETVERVAGPGAVFPRQPQDREDFLNAVYLTTKAASSGRPNKALELNNWKVAAPVLQSAGANPQFIVRETLHRLDDNVDPEQAFPLMPPQPMAQARQTQEPMQPGVTAPPTQARPGPGQLGPREQPPQP